MTATIGLLSPPRATARPAAQGEDLSVVKTVQTDADPINGAIIYNGDRITYTLTIRNLTGTPLAVDKAEDTLVSGTFFGVECIAGTPGIACEVNKTVTQVSIPALRKGAANTDTVIETANGVIWRNFTINPGQTTILRFKARVDCRAANSLIFNDAAVTYGGVSFIPSNQTQTTVQLKTSVLNAEGRPPLEGPSGCTTEAGGYDQDWGDYDQDGDLDLALATADQTVVYRNDNGQLVTAGNHAHRTFSVRWADVDNDGKLELISAGDFEITNGFRRGKNYIYDDNVFYIPNQTFITPDVLWRIDLADYDLDGALDLAAASYIDTAYRTQHNMCLLRLYKNTGGAFSPNECLIGPLTKESVWTPSESRHSYAVAWADTDQDSDLDLSVGDYGTPNRLHQNTGLQLGAASSQLGDNNSNADNTTSLAWADFDDDNYPDAAWGNQNQPARLYRNNRQALPNTTWNLAWSGPIHDTRSVAWGNFPTTPDRDASIAIDDDVALEYTLPFAFSFGRTTPRSIKRISINTNGMIELLEAGEVCRACGSWQNLHATNVHRLQDIDAIFAASADMTTGVIVEALPETTPDRVEITWLGVSYNDYWPDEVSPVEAAFETNPLMFKVILRNNGHVDWKLFHLNYAQADGDFFAGVYDERDDVELPLNLGSGSGFIPAGTSQRAFRFDTWAPANNRIQEIGWSGNDRYIATADDATLNPETYTLPFTFNYYGRSITGLCANTNGLIELLQSTDACQEYADPNTHATADYLIKQIDAIFAANDNLRTGVFVEGDSNRIAVTWLGTSYADNAYTSRPLAFKVILFSDQRIWWKFFDMKYINKSADLFSGSYGVSEGVADQVPGGSLSFRGQGINRRFQIYPVNTASVITPITHTLYLALGNYGQPNYLYQSAGGTLTGPGWTSNDSANTTSLAWVDYNGDGALDLTAGNFNGNASVYTATATGVVSVFPYDLTPSTGPIRSIAWADWDQDGDPDLATGNDGAPVRVLRNTGAFPMTVAWSASTADSTQSVAWADADLDGFPDLAVGNYGAPNKLYQNDGGVMDGTAIWTSAESLSTRHLTWGDVDGDGDLDLAGANDNQQNVLYLNRRFFMVGSSKYELGSVNDLAWGDYNNDGYPDLAFGGVDLETPGGGYVYLIKNNNGNLLFTRNGAIKLDMDGATSDLFDLAWGDYNRDGYIDLASAFPDQQEIRLYKNESGSGAWNIVQTIGGPAAYALDWVDIQRDGWLDLAVADSPDGAAPTLKVYLNQAVSSGINNFDFDDVIVPDNDLGDGLVFNLRGIDRDNDGDLDLSAINLGRQSQQFTTYGSFLNPRLAEANNQIASFPASSVAWGDVNGDRQQDLLFGGYGVATRLYRNTGSNTFCQAGSHPVNCPAGPNFDTGGRRLALFGDFDGNGSLDMADGVPGGQVKLYRNNGAVQSINGIEGYALAWGDADGDGQLDLFVGGRDGTPKPAYVYFNRRAEPYLDSTSTRWTVPSTDATLSAAWADYDNDNHLDLALGNCNSNRARSVQLYHNNGNNTFSLAAAAGLPTSGYCVRSLAWADYDGDSDSDLAIGNDGAPSYIYQNQGSFNGVFTQVWNSGDNANTYSVAWGDWNNDGKPDLALGNRGQNSRVYSNLSDSSHSVFLWVWKSDQVYNVTGLAWGDKDGDGDLDLAFSQDSGGVNGIFENGYVSPVHLGGQYKSLPRNPSYLRIQRPGANDAYFLSARAIQDNNISINYTVFDPAGDSILTNPAPAAYRFEYSTNGGAGWRTATLSGTTTHNGAAPPTGQAASVIWKAAADGVANDNVLFRISIVHHKSGGPVQYSVTRAVSPPFRVRSLTCEWPADPTITTRVNGAAATYAQVGETVSFAGGISAGSGVMTFTWQFGNGGIAIGQYNVPYSYTVAGTYPITLTVVGEPCPTIREVMATSVLTIGTTAGPTPTVTQRVYIPLIIRSGIGATEVFDPSVPRPTQVTGLTGRVEAEQTVLAWLPHLPGEAVHEYRIYRSSREGWPDFQLLGSVPVSLTGYADLTAKCGFMYYVTAVNAGGESAPSTASYISRSCQ